ncbi:hypothetical protein IBE33_09190 [Francisella philomiragia]|uniref:Uncharacterized protein n=1 Tax=Francisella tularensis subsp. novicida PA10-7858 TaxID=1386968 RepID=V5TB09_FRANO|nr:MULTISPECIES: hypothetical protein [Francisella]AHB60823.1 hypothetical protein N894_0055 [Francisella tularensis subsp. novicida PA10-7858]MBK2341683.1 hypothetical protein [Francisella philomiragia]
MKKIILTALIIAPMSLFAIDKSEMINITAEKLSVKPTDVQLNESSIDSGLVDTTWYATVNDKTYLCQNSWMGKSCHPMLKY